MSRRETSGTKMAIWGLFLMGLGVAFLLERFDVIHGSVVGHYWPSVFFVLALIHVFENRPGSATSFALLGAWFFAVRFEWHGLTFHNSWPIVLLAVGAGLVVKALSGEGYGGVDVIVDATRRRRMKEENHE